MPITETQSKPQRRFAPKHLIGFLRKTDRHQIGMVIGIVGIAIWPAAVVLASLFGLEKLLVPEYRTLIAFLSVVLYALLMCLTLKLTGSLWFAIGFHCGVEWCTVFIFGIRTPIIPHPEGTLLNIVFKGPAWITGGQSGLMASILMPLLIIALSLVLRVRFRQTQHLAKPSFSH